MIVKPKATHIDVCFECECGCIHWLDYKYVKKGYEIECYCGKVLEIPPTNLEQYTVNKLIEPNNKLKKILLAQGFDKTEINKVLPFVKQDTEAQMLKEALKLL